MEKNNDFFEWYKQKITGNPQDPPADAWQNIADELDTNDVWDRVAADLDHRGGWFSQQPWSYAIPAVLLLILSAGLFLYFGRNAADTPSATVSTYADADSGSHDNNDNKVAVDPSADRATAEDNAIPPAEVSDMTADRSYDEKPETLSAESETLAANAEIATDEKGASAEKVEASGEDERLRKEIPKETPADNGDASFSEERTLNEHISSKDQISSKDESRNDTITSEVAIAPQTHASGEERGRETIGEDDNASEHDNAIVRSQQKDDGEVAVEIAANDRDAIAISENASDSTASEYRPASAQREQQAIAPSTARFAFTHINLARIAMPDSMLTISPIVVAIQYDSAIARETTPLPAPQFSRTFEFGIAGSVKNTWLLNQTTFKGLERHTLTTTLPDFGKDIGVVLRYNFSPLFSAQAEGFFISDMGQRYNEYRKGKYIEREVDLNYFHGNLLFKYGNNAMVMDRLVNGHGIIAGVFFSKLKNARQTIDDHSTDIGDAYSLSNYGIMFGYEYNQRLFSHFFFTSGVRLNYGLKDIRSNAGLKTGTGSFDVNLGLRYRF